MVGIRDRDWRRGPTGPVSVPAGNIRPFSLFDTILCCGRWTATKAAPMIDEFPAHVAVGDCLVDRQENERTRQTAQRSGFLFLQSLNTASGLIGMIMVGFNVC